MTTIVQTPDPVLRATAAPVPKELFGTDKLSSLISTLKDSFLEVGCSEDGCSIDINL
jgi:peptide deformylase